MRSALRPVCLVLALSACVGAALPDEEGWTDLIAETGPDMKGWVRVAIPPSGKLSETSQWSIDPKTGYLVCDGTGGHDWLRWDRELGDFVYHVEWRFTPGTKSGYNSGIYARNSADGVVWHQAQTGDGSGGYLFGETMAGGKLKFFNLDKPEDGKSGKAKRVNRAGEWNTFEIRCQGKDMTLTVNGEPTSTWHDCEVPKGFVGVEAEGYRIEFRSIKVKSL